MPHPHRVPKYTYADPDLTPPTPGRDLVMTIGMVESLPGVGPKTGGGYIGHPLAIGPKHTRFVRGIDGIEMTLPNDQLKPWTTPFTAYALTARGIHPLAAQPGWEWLHWTVADHLAFDTDRGGREPLVIVACGAEKRSTPCAVGELYLGQQHTLARRAAATLTTDARTRVLSGLHGLLRLDDIIEPYDMRMGDPGSVSADTVREQAAAQGLLATPVVVLAPRAYAAIATAVWPHARTPFTGTRGIGEQRRVLSRIIAGAPLHELAA